MRIKGKGICTSIKWDREWCGYRWYYADRRMMPEGWVMRHQDDQFEEQGMDNQNK